MYSNNKKLSSGKNSYDNLIPYSNNISFLPGLFFNDNNDLHGML